MKEKLNIQYWQHKYGKLPVTLVIVAGLLGLVWAGYGLGHWHLHYLAAETARQSQRIDGMYRQIEQLEYRTHILQVELDIEKAANASLQQEMAMAQDETFALRREIAFYQKIMAPELEANGVIIDSLEVSANQRAGHYHFNLALVHLERQRDLVSGRVSLTLVGRRNGERATYDLFELAMIENDSRAFNMRYFNVFAGDFLMPEGFLPERIDVSVAVSGRRNAIEQSFFWQQLRQSPEPSREPGPVTSPNT